MGAQGKLGQQCQSVRPTEGLGIRGAILDEEKKRESVFKTSRLADTWNTASSKKPYLFHVNAKVNFTNWKLIFFKVNISKLIVERASGARGTQNQCIVSTDHPIVLNFYASATIDTQVHCAYKLKIYGLVVRGLSQRSNHSAGLWRSLKEEKKISCREWGWAPEWSRTERAPQRRRSGGPKSSEPVKKHFATMQHLGMVLKNRGQP
jgi:hypothetical protein